MLQFPLWKRVLILLVALLGIAYALPNVTGPWQPFLGYPTWAPGKPMNLGLDLRGGAHLLVRVRVEDVLVERLNSTNDAIRNALRESRIRASRFETDPETRSVSFVLREVQDEGQIRDIVFRAAPEFTVSVLNDRQFRLEMMEQAALELGENTIQQSLEVVNRRVNALGLTEPTIQRQGADRILIQVPGLDGTSDLKRILNAQARLTFHLADFERLNAALSARRAPPGFRLVPSLDVDSDGNPVQTYLVSRQVVVSGENLTNAQPTFQDGQPVISFTFDTAGAQRFGRATQENVSGYLAIMLDDRIISAPQINSPILGGNGIISGSFTLDSARELSLQLRGGALPAQMETIEERSVGPGLGQDSINAGSLASIIALGLVIVYMTISYGRFGVYANIALLLNLVLILGTLSALSATLTLPGIAGIVLTVGMAVDANVLIFERIREEARAGRPVMNAVDAGYSRALTTIIDANLTTFIAAVLLFAFGSGPIRGFSITLAIGLVTSMFTAIMVTRFFVVTHIRRNKLEALPIAGKAKVGGSSNAAGEA